MPPKGLFARRLLSLALAFAAHLPLACGSSVAEKPVYPFEDSSLGTDARVADLVSRLSLDEKADLMKNATPGIARLGIPAYEWWNEALHGVARAGRATVFPQAIGMAATWDPALIRETGSVIADEAREKYDEVRGTSQQGARYRGLTMWSPNINIFRDPRWGRGQETFGEDPLLTGTIGSAFVRGLQGDDPEKLRVAACAKHLAVHSGPEADRYRFNVNPLEADLQETYLPAFEALVKDGKVAGVMTAYNSIQGVPCSANPMLFGALKSWGFHGYTVSDCGAVYCIYEKFQLAPDFPSAEAMAVRAGLDLRCGSGDAQLGEAVRRGLLSEAELDASLSRLLRIWCRLGMLDTDRTRARTSAEPPRVETPENVDLARRVAERSLVLLENTGILPLDSAANPRLLVVGPNADSRPSLLGNYHGTPSDPVTLLEGLRRLVPKSATLRYVPGCDYAEDSGTLTVVPRTVLSSVCACDEPNNEGDTSGLTALVYSSPDFSGKAAGQRRDHQIDFKAGGLPGTENVASKEFSIRWTGNLNPGISGEHEFQVKVAGSVKVLLGDKVLLAGHSDSPETFRATIPLEAGTGHAITLEYVHRPSDAPAELRLLWNQPKPDAGFAAALEAAKESDVILFAGGISPNLEGEDMRVDYQGFSGGDRTAIELPAIQRKLFSALAATGKPVVFINFSGGAVAWPEIEEKAAAVIQAWYPGQQGGIALASLLFGQFNPSGRLPVTFYRSTTDLPAFDDYNMANRTYRYHRGPVQYSFGHGLSYTTFSYRDLKIEKNRDGRLEALVTLSNTGTRSGEEVLQVYATPPQNPRSRDLRSLAGFTRVLLAPGETTTVRLPLSPNVLNRWDPKSAAKTPVQGTWSFAAGGSSADSGVSTSWIQD